MNKKYPFAYKKKHISIFFSYFKFHFKTCTAAQFKHRILFAFSCICSRSIIINLQFDMIPEPNATATKTKRFARKKNASISKMENSTQRFDFTSEFDFWLWLSFVMNCTIRIYQIEFERIFFSRMNQKHWMMHASRLFCYSSFQHLFYIPQLCTTADLLLIF